MKKLEDQTQRFNETQFKKKTEKAKIDMMTGQQESEDRFIFGQKGEILFSDDEQAGEIGSGKPFDESDYTLQ